MKFIDKIMECFQRQEEVAPVEPEVIKTDKLLSQLGQNIVGRMKKIEEKYAVTKIQEIDAYSELEFYRDDKKHLHNISDDWVVFNQYYIRGFLTGIQVTFKDTGAFLVVEEESPYKGVLNKADIEAIKLMYGKCVRVAANYKNHVISRGEYFRNKAKMEEK